MPAEPVVVEKASPYKNITSLETGIFCMTRVFILYSLQQPNTYFAANVGHL
jgi:hypothetical protein